MSDWPIALSPNATWRDLGCALCLLVRPWRWRNGPALGQINARFKDWYPGSAVWLLNSGRSALYLVLKALNLKKDDEVIVQAFTCLAVPAPVIWAGGQPIFVDIDPESLNASLANLTKAISSRTRAIIVQHTFGNPAAVTQIKEAIGSRPIIIIEDCAHALGTGVDQKPLGSLGEAAIFSFGRDKAISSVFGGALVVNNLKLAQRVRLLATGLKPAPWSWIAQQLLHPIFTVPLAALLPPGTGVILKVLEQLKVLSKAIISQEYQGGRPPGWPFLYPNALASLAWRQFQELETTNNHRRQLAQIYTRLLPAGSVRPVFSRYPVLRYPVRVANSLAVLKAARLARVPLGDWYLSPVAPPKTNLKQVFYKPGQCPNAEQASRTIVNLPTHIHILPAQAENLARWLKPYV